MEIRHFFDEGTSTLSYLVFDADARIGVVIDPVLDFDPASARISTESAEAIAGVIDAEGLRIPLALDTHAHADHVSALSWFRSRYGAKTVIGTGIVEVQRTVRKLFNLDDDFSVEGSSFDVLVGDGERLDAGPFEIEAIHTPGHTPACMTYRIEDALFVGDTLLQPDYGTARCDFPGGSAAELYASISMLYEDWPPAMRLFTCHDYRPGGRPLAFESTLAEQRACNVQLSGATLPETFIEFRKRRDAELELPRLMLPAIQMNIRGGDAPQPESNGISYLKLPIDLFGRPGRL
jgi:glyoxylase-like metal-dependent hydrolase (beta-lactamase superfamily II)